MNLNSLGYRNVATVLCDDSVRAMIHRIIRLLSCAAYAQARTSKRQLPNLTVMIRFEFAGMPSLMEGRVVSHLAAECSSKASNFQADDPVSPVFSMNLTLFLRNWGKCLKPFPTKIF